MLMPVLRLVGIYLVVGLVIFGLFNRDKIGTLFGAENEATSVEEMASEHAESEMNESSDDAMTTNSAQNDNGQTNSSTASSNADAANAAPSEMATSPVASQSATPVQTTSASPSASQVDLDAELDNARRAFWNGDVNGAEAIYRQVVAAHPDSVDANGELGNILFSAGRFNDAAQFYYAVGEISHGAGNNAQLMNMIGVLQGIAPEKADQLREVAGIQPPWAPASLAN